VKTIRIVRQGQIEDDTYHVKAPTGSTFATICGYSEYLDYIEEDHEVTCETCIQLLESKLAMGGRVAQ